MSLKSKAKEEMLRQRKRKQLEDEALALARNAERLMSMQGGFALNGVRRDTPKDKPKAMYRNFQGVLPAKADPVHTPRTKVEYHGVMQDRELAARAAIREKEKLVMPLFNKGGDQLPTESDLKDFRSGLLRRRS